MRSPATKLSWGSETQNGSEWLGFWRDRPEMPKQLFDLVSAAEPEQHFLVKKANSGERTLYFP